jgi:small subunit ribosomal protein S17
MNAQSEARTSNRKELTGVVASDKMAKTIVVEVSRLDKHAKFVKRIKSAQRYKAHDEKNEAHVGDRVRIVETRPLSRDKRWRLVEIIAKAKTTEAGHDL